MSSPSPRPAGSPDVPRRSRWLRHPVVSGCVALTWLMLQSSVAPANLLTALVLGLVLPRLVDAFLFVRVSPHGLVAALRFVGVVGYDIVVSNIAVARIVLNPAARPQPAWVEVPLDVTHPYAITLLATVITTTPGTVSCVVEDGTDPACNRQRMILVHALDCSDPAQMARDIKSRYERPLKEIFEP